MNNRTRKHIATYSDSKLDRLINRDKYSLDNMIKSGNLTTIRRSINNRYQALVDEKQARMTGNHAFY